MTNEHIEGHDAITGIAECFEERGQEMVAALERDVANAEVDLDLLLAHQPGSLTVAGDLPLPAEAVEVEAAPTQLQT